MKKLALIISIIFTLLVSGCSLSPIFEKQDGAPQKPVDLSNVKNATPRPESKSLYGNNETYCVLDECYHVMPSSKGYVATGIASWYGTKFNHQLTSDGEKYEMLKMTAANKTLPLPTYVRVTNLENGKRVIVRVNDRGPFEKNRLIDLSYAAAYKLDMLPTGTALVKIEVLDPTKKYADNTLPISPAHKAMLYLQVGAFTIESHAETLKQRAIAVTQQPTKIFTTQANGKTLYHVKVGPISTVAKADQLTKQLQSQGFQTTKAEVMG